MVTETLPRVAHVGRFDCLTFQSKCRIIGSEGYSPVTGLNRMIGTADFPKISHVKKRAFLAAFSRRGKFEQGCEAS